MTAAAAGRAAAFLDGPAGRQHPLVTPEGVPLTVEVAGAGDRIGAFLLDLLFCMGAVAAVDLLLILLLAKGIGGAAATSIVLFTGTLARNLYFIGFELGARAATPGKRLLGLRVVDRRGGPLQPGAVIARNLTRELEAFLPIGILASLRGASGWDQLLLAAWAVGFAVVPLCNRLRLRGGDLIAGTLVIVLPRRRLAPDLADRAVEFTFTKAQLAAYGAFELQVLEQLLRAPATADSARLRREVAEKICRRIGWEGTLAPAEIDRFLGDFYAAERAELEQGQLFGRLRADKHAAG